MPRASSSWLTSCGWIWSPPGVCRVNEIAPPRSTAVLGPRIVRPGHGAQPVQRVRGDQVLVRRDLLHPEGGEVARGRGQADGLRDRRRPGLEAVRRRRERRPGHPDDLDHLAPAEERRQRGEQVVAAPEHADAGRPDHLVPGEDQQVGPEGVHVDGHLRDRLRGVDHDRRAVRVRRRGDLGDRVDGAEHVGDVDDRDDLGALVDQAGGEPALDVEPALLGHVEPAQRGAGPLGEELPRDDVRVVLHDGDDDLVARAQRGAERVGAEVQRLGGVLGEDDLVAGRGPDELGQHGPRGLERLGRLGTRAGASRGRRWRCG